MTYASTSELAAVTGSQHDMVTLQSILDEADRQVKIKILGADLTPPASSDILKVACLCYAKVALLDRLRMDGGNVAEPKYQWGHDDINMAIQHQELKAATAIETYINTAASNRHRLYLRKVNA